MLRFAKLISKAIPGFTALDEYFRLRYTGQYHRERYPRGHYYSPLPDIEEVRSKAEVLYNPNVDLGPSINLRKDAQRSLLGAIDRFYNEFPWKQESSTGNRFHFNQTYFCYGDALMLYSSLRFLSPKKVIEVGSGFTSALMLDTNDLFLQGTVRFTFIEPYPERLQFLLKDEDHKTARVVVDSVQNIPLETFKELEENDVLFIDSSHVAKIGSDVNHLIFNVLPILKPGVVIHFHDVLWPFEYPEEWIIEGRAWNEAYLLRAFLQYNHHFEVLLLNSYVGPAFGSFMAEHMPIFMKNTGGSLWLRKVS